jgi:hypothetical protein
MDVVAVDVAVDVAVAVAVAVQLFRSAAETHTCSAFKNSMCIVARPWSACRRQPSEFPGWACSECPARATTTPAASLRVPRDYRPLPHP